MRGRTTIALAVLLLAGCASNGDDGSGDLYLAVALETAVGTLISLEKTGDLPPEGAAFIDATLAYGTEACGILQDPTLDPAARRLALMTDLADERVAFDVAFQALAGSQSVDREVLLVVLPAINGARAAVRVALTEEVDPADYAKACISIDGLQVSWDLQHPPARPA